MKKGIRILIALNAIFFLVLAGLLFLAETYPFHPGDPLFALQSTAESSRVKLANNPDKRVELSFELVERRLADLAMVDNPDHVQTAVEAFDHVLTQAIQSIQSVSDEDAIGYYQDVQNLLVKVDIVLGSVERTISHDYLNALHEKVDSLLAATTPVEIQQLASGQSIPSMIGPKAIPFLGVDVDHVDFTLTDGHENLECIECHSAGVYVETSTACTSCHSYDQILTALAEDSDYEIKRSNRIYPYHFDDECSDCHNAVSWEPSEFDHRGIYDCISCHFDDYPENEQIASASMFSFISLASKDVNTTVDPHYPGDCINCHTDTEDWAEFNYDHQMETCESCHNNRGILEKLNDVIHECTREENCESCHTYDNHLEDYGDTCVNCHQDFENWLPAEIDHEKYPNCLTCHEKDIPDEQHYKSNCSTCHITWNWKTLALEHTGKADCQSCHEQPANHRAGSFVGQCSSCHSPYRWKPTTFNHTFGTCSTCHPSPAGHYPAQCSACHNNNSWLIVNVNHSTLTLCTNCHSTPVNHYPGACVNCHNASNWRDINYNHSGVTDCTLCHITPSGHLPGTCTACHQNTSYWVVSYDHTLSYPCSTCHNTPYDHWTGECSNCHVTSSWSEVNFDHTGFTLCNYCHLRPVGHPRGQCSNCHSTDTWEIPATPTPTPTNTLEPTLTPLPTGEPTATPLPTEEPTSTPVPTEEPTSTPVPTEEPTATPIPIREFTATPTPTEP